MLFIFNVFCCITPVNHIEYTCICARSSGDRATVSGTVCRGFKSLRARQYLKTNERIPISFHFF